MSACPQRSQPRLSTASLCPGRRSATLLSYAVLVALFAVVPARAADVRIRADEAVAVGVEENAPNTTVVAQGHVRVTEGSIDLRAPHLTVTKQPRIAILDGGVVGMDGLLVVSAAKMELDIDTHTLLLTDGQLVAKVGVTVAALAQQLATEHPELIRKMGRDAFTVRATKLTRNDGSTVDAEHVFLTTCAAEEGCTPLLSFTARSARIAPGDSAALTFPIFRLFTVPVFWLPWVSVPLSERKSGLLFPQANFAGPGGADVAVPVFITLGESADLTLAARYFFGTKNANNGGHYNDSLGVRGPGDHWDFRWRPAQEAIGELSLFHVYDTSLNDAGTGPRGNRGALHLVHQQALGSGRLGVNLDAVSDSQVLVDTELPLPRRNMPYLRSSGVYSQGFGGTSFALETNGIQDLRPLPCPSDDQTCSKHDGFDYLRTWGTELPATVAPVARIALGHAWPVGRLLTNGQLILSYEDALPGVHFVSGHIARVFSDASLVQTVPLLSGRYGTVAFRASERGEFLSRGESDSPGWRAGGYVDLTARSRIARTYESGLVHDFVPSFQLRALGVVQGLGRDASVPFSSGLFPATPAPRLLQNEFDMALPPGGAVQAITRVSTSWLRPNQAPITLNLEHHLAFAPFDAGQFRGALEVNLGLNQIKLDSGVDITAKRWTFTNLSYSRRFGLDSMTLRAQYLNGATDDLIARGLDVLFTPQSEIQSAGTVSQTLAVGGAANVVLGTWRIAASATLSKTLGPNPVTQDYSIQLFYEAESCGRLSLALHWIYWPGQPIAAPVPVPNFELGNVREVAALANSAAAQ